MVNLSAVVRHARLGYLTAAGVLALLAAACSGGDTAEPAKPVSETTSASGAPGTSCATPGLTAPAGCWVEVLPLGSGGFPASPGSSDTPKWEPGKFPVTLPPRLAFNGQLWMTAQTLAFSSPDGLTWTQHEKTDVGERIYQTIVYFKDKLWMFGGMDYQARTFLNDIWSSSDGITWEQAGRAAWSGRSGAAVVVYHDRLWLFGGANHAAQDRSTDGFLNDVWVSDDGLSWKQVTEAAPWPARDYAGVLVFKGELFMAGGEGRADVWHSANGADWTELTPEADWKPRNGFAKLVFDGKLWVFGGTVGKSTNAVNDVWYSSDGATWIRQAEHAPWAPRGPLAVVFQDKIWIYSGKHTGAADNWGGDLWQMAATGATR